MVSDTAGDPSVYLTFDPPPMSQPFRVEVLVCAPGVDGLWLDASMPAHKHGMNYTPRIATLGAGRFEVDGLVFHMRGVWQIRVETDVDGTSYSHVLDVMVP